MEKVVTFGELMLRLNPPSNLKFIQTNSLNYSFAGSEANVSVSLSYFGLSSHFVTKLPDNIIGDAAKRTLKYFNVSDDFIISGDGRLGILYLENGYSYRKSRVDYDRKNSLFSLSKVNDFDWKKILDKADIFHFSGITPALSDELAEACLNACKYAHSNNIKVSFDVNYRSKLWSKKAAAESLKKYLPYIDIFIANEEDATLFVNKYINQEVKSHINEERYSSLIMEIKSLGKMSKVFISLRESITANKNMWSAMLYDGEKLYKSKKYDIDIVDRVGAGDSFAAGVIYSELKKFDSQQQLEFSVAASCLKHSIHNDFNLVTIDDVNELINNNGNSRINR